MRKSIVLIILIIYSALGQQQNNPKGFIETNRVFLFDTINGNQAGNNGFTYSFTFNRNFTNIPRVGLAIYTMDFQYSSVFSCQVTGDTTITAASLLITTQNTGNNNQLYIMYIATDHDYLGVYMPGPLITYMLNQGTPNLVTQSFVFNFKEQISQSSQVSNIRVSVFLTGITSSSQLVSNGYPTNHTYFFLNSKIVSSTNYQIDVSVNSLYGDITVKQVQYTIIYFDVSLMQVFRYLIDKGDVTLQNFGGTSDSSSKSITLTPLAYNASFSNLMIFYGISGLQCKQGISIALSAFYQSYLNPVTNATNVLLSMQTWKLTLMMEAEYSFIQYKSLNCDIPGANCDGNCLTSLQPHYVVAGVCNFCQSSCLSCNITNTNLKCDTCDSTRYLNNASGLCICLSGFYDNTQTNICNSCFPCLTCNLKGVCLSCDASLNMVLNRILDFCQCAPGYYSNFINSTNNKTSSTLNNTTPCLKCPENCLYCLNSTFCLACNTVTYLNQTGVCLSICSTEQKYDASGNLCSFSSSSMFDQAGRLGYEWQYTSSESQLSILLTFSQPDTLFYYYQNGAGYAIANNANGNQALSEAANLYYDDGSNSAGYAGQFSQGSNANGGAGGGGGFRGGFGGASAAGSSVGSIESTPASIFNNPQLNNAAGSQNAASIGNLFQKGMIDNSALNGSYYGLGQQQFYKYLYQNYLTSNGKSYSYYDNYGIPYGKYNLSTNPPIKNPSFSDALSKNIAFSVNNQNIPFTMVPVTNNQFKLTATVSKSYNGESGNLIVKNPGLIRSGATTTQLTNVSKQIYIYNCAIPSYVSAAKSLQDSNSVIVDVLWGIGKYPLFLGFGWIFMPLMLVLQYIMSLNYIDITKPLNLQLFLASFADFRNPSIFYNPVRNNIDKSVINQNQIYLNLQRYNRFDKGIDFMKNCFQFFFVPFLSVILYALVIGINKILNSSKRNIPFISNYFQPRFPLHIAAYTLVQALPVSFFFFAQLNDTRYNSANQNNTGYSVFNVAMSYLAFFLTCTIPIMVMTHMYFIYTTKENKVKSAKDFKTLFKNLLQSSPQNHQTACLNDPLWTGNQQQIVSYGFGLSIFGMALLFGFFTSFFIDNYPWQLTGLIIICALILAFAASSDHFGSWPLKFFWVIFCALLLAFLFLMAGIGSNTSSSPCDLQNLGYLGIGFLYALILLAAAASIWILWFTFYQIYNNYFKNRRFIQNLNEKKQLLDDKPQRIKGFESNTKLKSTYLKNPIQSQIGSRSNIGQSQIGSKMNIGQSQSKLNGYGGSINNGIDRNRINTNIYDKQPNTEDRMIIRQDHDGQQDEVSNNLRQLLRFYQIKPQNGYYIFVTDTTKQEYVFDDNIGKRLKEKQPIYIDNNQAIIDRDNQYLGNYQNLKPSKSKLSQNDHQNFTINQRELIKNKSSEVQAPVVIRYTSSHQLDDIQSKRLVRKPQTIINNIYKINGIQYKKEGVDNNGFFIMRNLQTNQIRKVQGKNFLSNQQQQIQQKLSDSLQKRLNQVKSKQNEQNQKRIFISPQIQKNQVTFQSKRKFRHNNQDYIDLGQQGNFFKLFNTNTNKQQKVTKDVYINMVVKSFQNRVNFNGIDYDFDYVGLSQSIHLKEAYSNKPKIVSKDQFIRLKQQNQQSFRMFINQGANNQKNTFIVNRTQIVKINQDQNSQINNLLLIQSKAGRQDPYNASRNNEVKIQTKEIEMVQYKTTNKEEYQQQIEDEQVQGQGQTIEEVLQKSPGPFHLFVVPSIKVQQIDGADTYQKQDAIQKIILQGKNVMIYMQKAQRKHPGAIIFMVDLSNKEEYRLN